MSQISRDRWRSSGATRSVSMSWSCDRSLFVAPYGEMYVIELQRLFMQFRLFIVTLIFPCADITEIHIVALCFTGVLIFSTEMPATGLVAVQSVTAQKFAEFKEVGRTTSIFQLLIEFCSAAGNLDILPEFFTQRWNFFEINLK